MKRFVFRLETLLNHRQAVEDLREQEFAVAQGRLDVARLQLQTLEAHYQRIVAERPDVAGGARFDAPAIQSREKYVEALQTQIASQRERVEVARLIAEEMRVQMVAARQAREAVTRLREKDLLDYKAEMHRKEQDELDEIGAVRHARQQSAETALRSATIGVQRRIVEADAPGSDAGPETGRTS